MADRRRRAGAAAAPAAATPAAAASLAAAALAELRARCMGLPEVTESDSWGHPNFRAGKRTFAAFEWVDGRPTIALKLGADEVDQLLLGDSAFFASPYGRGQWVSVCADAELDWSFLTTLLERSYRGVALKRMLAALDRR